MAMITNETAEVGLTSTRSEETKGRSHSVYKFDNIGFTVKVKNKSKEVVDKKIIDGISATVKSGRVLAIMGPSGAGKTTLINVLTMTAFGGVSTGSAHLNGEPLTVDSFNKDCFVVTQQDNHWPFLTCRETIMYAAQLYLGKSASQVEATVDDLIRKMGLQSCRDTLVGNMFMQGLSGGQKRRLSIALALVKQPTLMFLDEPTSGLDAAAAANIMREITSLAVAENLCIVCTIHQPSSKVYAGFDQVMILSGGREAFTGEVSETQEYFRGIGYELDAFSNPAEYFLDLVNADFVDSDQVNKILDAWAETKSSGGLKSSKSAEELSKQLATGPENSPRSRSALEKRSTGMMHEMHVMLNRHAKLVVKDPVLYLARMMIFFMANLYFSLVYIETRTRTQDQVLNRLWLCVWFIGVPANMGVVAVYANNEEFKSVKKEIKNGMVSPYSYVLAKTILEIPIMFAFALCALGVPAYLVTNFAPEGFGIMMLLWAVSIYCWEAISEVLAVSFDNPLMGVMQFMGIWFSAFLYGGFLIPGEDMVWPLKIFFYIMPIKYTVRSMVYTDFHFSEYDSCDKSKYRNELCFGEYNQKKNDGDEVLDGIADVYPLITSKDYSWEDIGVLLAMAVFYKAVYVGIMIMKSKQVTTIKPHAS